MKEDKNNIISAAKSGDKDALHKLCSLYQDKVFTHCFRILENKNDAEDMAQETFIKMINGINTLNDITKFESWLFSIASNCCKSYMRKKKPSLTKSEDPDDFFNQLADESVSSNPEQTLLDSERAKIIKDMLSTLPKEQHQTIFLYYFSDKSVKEISEEMQVSEHCVRGRIRLGRKSISKQLKALNRLDSYAYMGALVVFKDLIKPASLKSIIGAVNSVVAKVLAVTMTVAVTGLCVYGAYNLYLLSELDTPFWEEKSKSKQTISCSMPDRFLEYDVSMSLDVSNEWEVVGTPDAYEWKYGFIPICRYSVNDVTMAEISYKLSHSSRRDIDKEIEDFSFNVELELREWKHSFEKLNSDIAIGKKEKNGFTRLYGIVRSDIETDTDDASSGYYYSYIIADVYDNSFNMNEFIDILETVELSKISHKNSLWFERCVVSRLAFDFDESKRYISEEDKHYKKTYSIDDSSVLNICTAISNLHAEKSLTANEIDKYIQGSQFVSVAGYEKDTLNYELTVIVEFYDSGLISIKENYNSETEQYFYSSQVKELYNQIKSFKEGA